MHKRRHTRAHAASSIAETLNGGYGSDGGGGGGGGGGGDSKRTREQTGSERASERARERGVRLVCLTRSIRCSDALREGALTARALTRARVCGHDCVARLQVAIIVQHFLFALCGALDCARVVVARLNLLEEREGRRERRLLRHFATFCQSADRRSPRARADQASTHCLREATAECCKRKKKLRLRTDKKSCSPCFEVTWRYTIVQHMSERLLCVHSQTLKIYFA